MNQGELKWGSAKHEQDLEETVAALQKNMNTDAYYYLGKRGISKDTAELLRIGYVPGRIGFYVSDRNDPVSESFENRVVIPIFNAGGDIVDLVGRSVDHKEPKYKSLYGIEDVFYQEQLLTDSEDLILCNGLFDVITLKQSHLPGICLPNMKMFKEVHAERLRDKRVFICMGNDENGRREAVRIQGMLAACSNEAFIVQLPEAVKDINDLFARVQQPVDVMVKLLNHAIEETLYAPLAPDIRNATLFNEEYIKRHREQANRLTTGLDALDALLGGGLPGGLMVMSGPPGCGKTTLMKQIADRLSALQHPVLYISWDMSQFELWAISIARVLGASYGSVLRGEHEPEAVQSANQVYMQAGKMQWTLEGSLTAALQQIEAAVEKITVVTGRTPLVFIDSLQQFLAADEEAKVKGGLSPHHVKEWSREWNVPVFAALPAERPEELPIELRSASDLVLAIEPRGHTADGAWSVELQAVKNRSGATGAVRAKFYENQAHFSDVLW
ncbi:MAG: DnaB-like helicase [Paenibacillaceae bacterium]|nr:DnaB-like helicase [Paenibacillaceae bacterium]